MSIKQVLNIDYKNENGLILEWNYTNFSNTYVFFRHILVLYTNNRDEAYFFVNKYVSRIKPGDFYCIYYFNSKGNLKILRWK